MKTKDQLKEELIKQIEHAVDREVGRLELLLGGEVQIRDFNYMQFFRVREASEYIIGRFAIYKEIATRTKLIELKARKELLIEKFCSPNTKVDQIEKIREEVMRIDERVLALGLPVDVFEARKKLYLINKTLS